MIVIYAIEGLPINKMVKRGFSALGLGEFNSNAQYNWETVVKSRLSFNT